VIDFIAREHLGDLASVIALFISTFGFIIIIINGVKTKNLTLQVRQDIKRTDTFTDFTSALSSMEEIKTLHRKQAWEILPERYSALRKTLINIKQSNPDMTDSNKQTMQNTIAILRNLEKQVESTNIHKTTPPDVTKLNRMISNQIDRLQPILIEIRNQIGR